MIVLGESNFVLELALLQGEADHAQRILELAEQQQLQLIIPACSLQEPYQTLLRRRSQRKELSQKLQSELTLLKRSKPYAELAATSEQLAQTLDASTQAETDRLEDTIEKLLQICVVPPLSADVIKAAQGVQLTHDLDPHDALVFASIDSTLKNLGAGPKIFANRNSKDFATPLIENYLGKYECRPLTSFRSAREFIDNSLSKETS